MVYSTDSHETFYEVKIFHTTHNTYTNNTYCRHNIDRPRFVTHDIEMIMYSDTEVGINNT